MEPAAPDRAVDEAAILAITRPHRNLWTYYLLSCLVFPPLLVIVGPYLWFRYQTMRYQFTPEGISMSWGILFRRQVIINYARIQDIHLRSNLIERWLGLAKILIQTASGRSDAEMTIEGLQEFEAVRDFLYSKMRGVKDHPTTSNHSAGDVPMAATVELVATLQGVTAELRALREGLSRRPPA